MAAVLSPPSSGGLPKHSTLLLDLLSSSSSLPPWKSHAVNRTNELLSCARTALKIGQQQYKQRQQQLELQQQSQQQHQGSSIFKIKQQQSENSLPEWLLDVNPAQLTLYQQSPHYNDHYHTTTTTSPATAQDSPISLLSDSQSLLSLLDTNLSQLHTLVRKRGHTNDPTIQINNLIHKFNEAAQEMKQVCELLRLVGTMPPPPLHDDNSNNENNGRRKKSSSKQRRKHYELVSSQLETYAKERTDKLKKELETRSQVIRDQTHRRKLLSTGGAGAAASGVGGIATNNAPLSASTSVASTRLAQPTRLPTTNSKSGGVGNNTNAASQFQSPLFTATSGGGGGGASVNNIGSQRRRNVNASNASNSTSTTSTGGYSGYAGYGGVTSSSAPSTSTITSSSGIAPSFATGIRQRKQQQQQQQSRIQIDHGDDDDKYNKDGNGGGESSVQQQIYERRQNRAAQSRLASARLAEKSIAELGVMFTKMSTLISQQGETLERIEDDVEAAGLDIDAGHDELVKVYGMTKGNRGLILKVFGILIFLIVFMKLY